MRIRKRLAAMLPLLLLIVALATPGPAAAIIPPSEGGTTQFPGRPMMSGGDCHGIAHGKVDGKLVLFIPNHCRAYYDNVTWHTTGAPAKINNNVTIGTWGEEISDWADDDLAYIYLNSTWSPTSGLNRIYRGDVSGSNYWTITRQPVSSDGCSAYPLTYNTVYDNWQSSQSSDVPYGTGQATGKDTSPSSGCFILTTSGWHQGQCCTSGVPFISEGLGVTNLAGYAVGSYNCEVWSNGSCVAGYAADLYYRPMWRGLKDLDDYWETHGTNAGARLCIDSDC